MKIKYFGHSCFLVGDILIDPFISGNPNLSIKPEDIKCKYILVTHGHDDHLGDSIKIAKANDATIICTFEISLMANEQGVKTEGMNLGGN